MKERETVGVAWRGGVAAMEMMHSSARTTWGFSVEQVNLFTKA